LDAAEREGIELPYICRSGACSSCVAVLKSGTLNQESQNYLNETQLEAGFALLCSAYPTSDCVIQTHQEEQFY
jgi:ferredoxin